MNPTLDQLPPDVQFEILLNSDLQTIREYCQTFPKLRTLCLDNRLWQQKMLELLRDNKVETTENFSQIDNWALFYRQMLDIIYSHRIYTNLWLKRESVSGPINSQIEIIANINTHRRDAAHKCIKHIKEYQIEPFYSLTNKYDLNDPDWQNRRDTYLEESILINNFISPQSNPTLNSFTLFRESSSSGIPRPVFTLRTDKVEEMYQTIAFMYTHRETIKNITMNMEEMHGRPLSLIARVFDREFSTVPELNKYSTPGYKFTTADVKFIFDKLKTKAVKYYVVPGTFYDCVKVQPFESLPLAIYQPMNNYTFASIVKTTEGYKGGSKYPGFSIYELDILANFVDVDESDAIRCAGKFLGDSKNITNYQNEFFDLHPNPGNTCLNLIKIKGKNVPEVLFTISGDDEKQMSEFIASLINHRSKISKIDNQLGDFIRTLWNDIVFLQRGYPINLIYTGDDVDRVLRAYYHNVDIHYIIEKSQITPCS